MEGMACQDLLHGTCSLSFVDSRDLKKSIEEDLNDIIEAAIRNFTEKKMGSIAQHCTGLAWIHFQLSHKVMW